jgi:hypothetical protein
MRKIVEAWAKPPSQKFVLETRLRALSSPHHALARRLESPTVFRRT